MKTGKLFRNNSLLLNEIEIDEKLKSKQETLVSGTNIKTINGVPILGEGDIIVEGSGGNTAAFSQDFTEAEMTNKVATVEHNLNTENIVVNVYDQEGKLVIPEDVIIVDANTVTIDVSTLILTEIKVVVLASGGTSGGTGSGTSYNSITETNNNTTIGNNSINIGVDNTIKHKQLTNITNYDDGALNIEISLPQTGRARVETDIEFLEDINASTTIHGEGSEQAQYFGLVSGKWGVHSTQVSTDSPVKNQRYVIKWEQIDDVRSLYVDEEFKCSRDTSHLNLTSPPYHMYCIYPGDVNRTLHTKRSYLKIFVEDVLVADLIPVVKSDQTICWYDKLRDKYYGEGMTLTSTDPVASEPFENTGTETKQIDIKGDTINFEGTTLDVSGIQNIIGLPTEEKLKCFIPNSISYFSPTVLERTLIHNMKKEELYTVYDDLVTRFPDFIKRMDDIGASVDGNEIRHYQIGFNEYKIGNSIYGGGATNVYTTELQPRRVLNITGVHGDEKTASYGTALFFKELLENSEAAWANQILSSLTIEVVPIFNPDGFDAATRANANGVDLNRNSTATAPQPETVAFNNIMNLYSDYYACIDLHSSERNYSWLSIYNVSDWTNHLYTYSAQFFARVCTNWKAYYAAHGMGTNNIFFTYTHDIAGTYAAGFMRKFNRPAIISETIRDLSATNSDTNYLTACKCTIDYEANILLALCH